jgi:phosphoheptose isomerase
VTAIPCGAGHLAELRSALDRFGPAAELADRWGARLARILPAGGRLLACGNGGSAAQAQHLTAELVGRYRDDRPAYSAIPLHTDTCSATAIGNDFHAEEVFARQVEAHGRRGDVLVAMSTSGRSRNVLRAAERARERGGLPGTAARSPWSPRSGPTRPVSGCAPCWPARCGCAPCRWRAARR